MSASVIILIASSFILLQEEGGKKKEKKRQKRRRNKNSNRTVLSIASEAVTENQQPDCHVANQECSRALWYLASSAGRRKKTSNKIVMLSV